MKAFFKFNGRKWFAAAYWHNNGRRSIKFNLNIIWKESKTIKKFIKQFISISAHEWMHQLIWEQDEDIWKNFDDHIVVLPIMDEVYYNL